MNCWSKITSLKMINNLFITWNAGNWTSNYCKLLGMLATEQVPTVNYWECFKFCKIISIKFFMIVNYFLNEMLMNESIKDKKIYFAWNRINIRIDHHMNKIRNSLHFKAVWISISRRYNNWKLNFTGIWKNWLNIDWHKLLKTLW